jgi:hypothetical protein
MGFFADDLSPTTYFRRRRINSMVMIEMLSRRCTLFLITWLIVIASATAQPYGCHLHDHEMRVEEPDPINMAITRASIARSDSVNILHYDIHLDVTDFGGVLKGVTTVMLTPKIDNIDTLLFDLAKLKVDSVLFQGQLLTFDHQDPYLFVYLPNAYNPNDTLAITVHYGGKPLRDPIWGGFYFEGGYAYNLGIGISSNPPNFGRVWYPCFDNFVERATYDIHVLSSAGRKGYAIGDFVSETVVGQDSFWRHYRMEQLLPTYLTNVAVSNYVAHRDTHTGIYGDVPIELLGRPNNINEMISGFARLGDAIDAIEHWYGSYPWSRVGYVLTTAGAMEHPTNVAFPESSLNNGNGNVPLMTHELGHHWWGNITTLREPTDMWIKEGNAEYCAHLLDEWSDGREAFVNTVKSNHEVVLTTVHQEDGDFLPLSGIPFANIYGRHTYLKGASVLHNLRGYLGDSLFRTGQMAILNDFAYNAIDAETYRDHLTQVTGIDAGPFFDAWIFNPGFSSFKIHSWQSTPVPEGQHVQFTLKQGIRATTSYHVNVPIEVSFYSSDWQVYYTTVQAGDLFSVHSVIVPFEPVHIALNERYLLNQARLDYQRILTSTGNNIYPFVKFRVNVQNISDSALVRIDHHWIAPDPVIDQPQLKISSTNFWVVSGLFPLGFKAQGRLYYDAQASNAFLDSDLAGVNEDSLLLLFRPNATAVWQKYPSYNLLKFVPTDGKGEILINDLQPGEYALGRGQFQEVSSIPELNEETLKLFPNPSSGTLFLEWTSSQSMPQTIIWYDMMGRVIFKEDLSDNIGIHSLRVPDVYPGIYPIQIVTTKNNSIYKLMTIN